MFFSPRFGGTALSVLVVPAVFAGKNRDFVDVLISRIGSYLSDVQYL